MLQAISCFLLPLQKQQIFCLHDNRGRMQLFATVPFLPVLYSCLCKNEPEKARFSKDHIKERLTHSPDLGDAAALTFGVDIATETEREWSYGSDSGSEGGWLAA